MLLLDCLVRFFHPLWFCVLITVTLSSGCVSQSSSTRTHELSSPEYDAQNFPVKNSFSQTAVSGPDDIFATIKTNKGDIKIRLFPDIVPKTVENFTTHATNGYYNGTIFHRVIDGFMIQGGDPKGDGTGGRSIWGGYFENEFDRRLSNISGSISMANSGPNTNGSQFFINLKDNSYLDFYNQPKRGGSTVFGQVVEGMGVVNLIASVETNRQNKPFVKVKIESIKIDPNRQQPMSGKQNNKKMREIGLESANLPSTPDRQLNTPETISAEEIFDLGEFDF